MPAEHGPVEVTLRQAYGRALGILIGLLGDFDTAEDALQDAIEKALLRWPSELPDQPVAWLVQTARNASIDGFRRKKVHQNWLTLTRPLAEDAQPAAPGGQGTVDDDFLRLIFTCCHPALAPDAQIVLTLRSVLGFEVPEVARSLLISESAVNKRLVRTKYKIRASGIRYEIPAAHRLPERLSTVCDVLYLVFNEGYSHPTAQHDIDLCREAIRLARIVSRLFPDDSSVQSLLALMLLSHARIDARTANNGDFVPLDRQDRARWNRAEIREGLDILDDVFTRRRLPTSYQIQAAISAIHCKATTAADTHWVEIAALYDRLMDIDDSPVISLNRSVALIQSGRVDAGAAALAALGETGSLAGYQPYYAARAFAFEKLGDKGAAAKMYRKAAALAVSDFERRFLEKRLEALKTDS